MMLPDGSIIPSYVQTETMGTSAPSTSFGNMALKQGEVRDIIYPDDKRSVTKKFVEYAVVVQERNNNGPAVSVLYPNCIVANLFGGTADRVRYTYRKASKKPAAKKGIADGSKVLMLCVNGEIRRAYIVGGLNDDLTPEKKDDGHNLKFEFNGVQVGIDKDGQLQIRYRGATAIDGKLDQNANADAEGSTIIFNKDGGIKLYTKDEKQFIFLDHANKKLEVLADEEWKVTVNKKLTFDVGDAIAVTGKKGCSIEVSDNITMKSSGVLVGDATDHWLLADTYRKAESQMLNQIATAMTTLQGLISTCATALQAAGKANIPPIVGGAAAATPFTAAATALTSAAPIFSQVSSAIQSFESAASTYLSKKNKND
jgi:hypothetical protein